MTYKQKYRAGSLITSLDDLLFLIKMDTWLYYRDRKPLHPSVVYNWPLRVVIGALGRKQLRIAERIIYVNSDTVNENKQERM